MKLSPVRPSAFQCPSNKSSSAVLGLSFDWDVIEEQPGELILGGLVAAKRKILLNEKHVDTFQTKPGLERSTIGHEAGHWDVDIDRGSVLHPSLPGMETTPHVVMRHSSKSDVMVKVLNRAIAGDERCRDLYLKLHQGQDTPEVRSTVDRYQSALLMPEWLIREAQQRYDFTRWPDLYDLAAEAKVNISNLTTRLTRLGLLYIDQKTRRLYPNQDAFSGQGSLF
ncbi:MAG: hypothetical protein QM754_16265 [Tepidisphaeraceae bacterium]